MIEVKHSFPRSFLWGTATASHQVEGHNTNNDWAQWESESGRIVNGHRAGLACDWWGGRWQEDLDRAVAAGQNSHRFSLEWSRLEPEPGIWSEQAVAKYREILKGARERGLSPMVTLHHFTNPLWLMESGGWTNSQVVEKFRLYTSKVVEAFGDIVAFWVTINEPNVYAYSAYSAGDFPPGKRDFELTIQVMINMVRAHGLAYHVIHEKQPHAQVGLAHHYRSMVPAPGFRPLNQIVTSLRSSIFNSVIADSCVDGIFRLPWRRYSIPEAKGTQDFLGLQYYTREHVVFDPLAIHDLFGRGFFPPGSDLSPTHFIANEPEGFWEALKWAHQYNLPIYVTENGVEDDQDELRQRYLIQHIRTLWDAVNFNWQVKGYYYWTLVDNFEWERGWSQRFGLWGLDQGTQKRTKRKSADLYAAICKEGALTSDLVQEYSPELLPIIFPPSQPGELPRSIFE